MFPSLRGNEPSAARSQMQPEHAACGSAHQISFSAAKVPSPTPAKTGQGEKTMNRTTLAAITLVSALATPVVVNATAPKAAPIVAGIVPSKPQEPTCTRQVRVVYAGYGEA